MAQDPEHDEEQDASEETLDVSHDLDMVPVYTSATVDAEMEGDMICGVLADTGIVAVLSRSQFPSFGVTVRVPRARLEEAERLIAEAQAAGPEAAAEGERESEEKH
jgi:hypothetical protein